MLEVVVPTSMPVDLRSEIRCGLFLKQSHTNKSSRPQSAHCVMLMDVSWYVAMLQIVGRMRILALRKEQCL